MGQDGRHMILEDFWTILRDQGLDGQPFKVEATILSVFGGEPTHENHQHGSYIAHNSPTGEDK